MAIKEVYQGIGADGQILLMQHLWACLLYKEDDIVQHPPLFRELEHQLRSLAVEGKESDKNKPRPILTLSLGTAYKSLVMVLQSYGKAITFESLACGLLPALASRHIGQSAQKC